MADLREELTSAFEEEEENDEEQGKTEEEAEGKASEDEGSSGDGQGDGEDGDDGDNDDTGSSDDGDDDGDEGAIGDAEGKKEPEGINAPIGFSPEAREQWKDTPKAIQEQVQKREQEIETAMRGTAEARRSHAHIEKLAQSYAPILAAEGATNPMQAIEGLFRTVAELRVGSPQQIASKMAGLIGHYGVDISMLDQALSGQQPQSTEMSEMSQLLDQRLAPLQDMLNQQNQNQQNQETQNRATVDTELEEFSKNAEFLNDVRYDMADLIDLASKQNRKLGFQEAYDKACAMHPQISKIMEERTAGEKLKNAGNLADKKINASSSLRTGSGKQSSGDKTLDLRGQLLANWEDAS